MGKDRRHNRNKVSSCKTCAKRLRSDNMKRHSQTCSRIISNISRIRCTLCWKTYHKKYMPMHKKNKHSAVTKERWEELAYEEA